MEMQTEKKKEINENINRRNEAKENASRRDKRTCKQKRDK